MTYRFGDFELDEERFELRRAGRRVAIAPKPLALLLYLARRHPAVVSRRELLRTLWPDARVTDLSLSRAVRAARRALGEAAEEEAGTIRTVRCRGYAFAGAQDGRRAEPDPREEATHGEAPFIGRVRELRRLEGALDLLEAGYGSIVRIAGEAGVGKSRLLDELVARARLRGARAALGSCREDDGTPAIWPWPEIAAGLVEGEAGPSSSEPALALLRELTSAEVDDRSRDSGAVAIRRFRLFHDFATLIRRASAGAPVVLLVEDLHWAGAEAAELLRFVGRSLRDAPVLLAISYRVPDPGRAAAVESALGELARLCRALPEIRLSGFPATEADAYVQALTGRKPGSRLARRLFEATAGNPLLLREIVPALAHHERAGLESLGFPVPRSVDAMVRARLARLSSAARDLVGMASLLGSSGAIGRLARASGHRLDVVHRLIDEARAQDLLDVSPGDRFRFRHGIARAAVHASLGGRRRAALARRIARSIDVRPARGGDRQSEARSERGREAIRKASSSTSKRAAGSSGSQRVRSSA